MARRTATAFPKGLGGEGRIGHGHRAIEGRFQPDPTATPNRIFT